jgi:hypothetical protein
MPYKKHHYRDANSQMRLLACRFYNFSQSGIYAVKRE